MLKRTIFVTLLVVASSCGRNPVTGKTEMQFVSESQEISIGEDIYSLMQQASGGPYLTEPSIQNYIEKVGQEIAACSDRPNLPYSFVVLNSSLPNAWSLPGGKIAIHLGLLLELKSEAELAAVLSHEIVHSAARHGALALERMLFLDLGIKGLYNLFKESSLEESIVGSASAGANLLQMKYSRAAELEADRFGIQYMTAAGYDPKAAVELQKTFLRLSHGEKRAWLEGLLATHPPSEERLEANEETVAKIAPTQEAIVAEENYKAALAPLLAARPAYEKCDEGIQALEKGDPEKALRLAEEALAIEPKEGHFFLLAGKAEYALERYAEAFNSLTCAIDVNPSYYDYYLQRGFSAYQIGKMEKACRDFEKSIELFATAEAHTALGLIALREGDRQKAREHFGIAADSPSPAGQRAMRELARMDVPLKPEQFIRVETSKDQEGDLLLLLVNESEIAVHNIMIELRAYGEEKQPLGKRRMIIKETIEPHSALKKNTALAAQKEVQVTVLAVDPAE